MRIIPHNGAFAQVKICPKNKQFPKDRVSNRIPTFSLSPIQQQALALYEAGLNVFPQPLGKKGGYPWKQLQYTRLDLSDHLHGLLPLFAGECNIAVMCGRTSGNLFVIDCESSGAFAHHITQMKQRHIPIWAVETARGGHIYLKCAEGEVENIKPGILPYAEIKGQGGYVLASGSVHPNGAIYRWYAQEGEGIPTISINDLDWLRNTNGEKIVLSYSYTRQNHYIQPWKLSSQTTALSQHTQDYLENGHLINEGSRNNRLFNTACDLAGNNYNEDKVHQLLQQKAKLSGLSSTEISQTIRSAFSREREPAVKNTKPVQEWEYAFYYLTQAEWSGRSSHTKRALMIALIECGRRSNNPNGIFRASIRELSQLARIGTATVQRLLPFFLNDEKPILFSCGYDTNSKASLWRFSSHILRIGKQAKLKMDTSPLLPPWLSYSVSIFNSDLAEREGVGLGGLYLYMMLQAYDAPLMPSEIAELVSMTVNQVNYALNKLQSLDMVVRESSGWRFVAVVLDEVAEAVNVVGRGLQRAGRYARERAVFIGQKLYQSRLHREMDGYFEHFKKFSRNMKRAISHIGDFMQDPLLRDSLIMGGQVTLDAEM